ncbi:MAG: cation:proton antiporter [Candidatus Micrarchaeia archaeon]
MEQIFVDLSLFLIIALITSFILRLFRQPLIIGYILAGVFIGPYFLGMEHMESIAGFASIGVAFLLFTVGLNLNIEVTREVGKVAVVTGLGQIIFTSLVGYLISVGLGFPPVESLYIAVALTFSSTIIIMKLLADKGDLDTLYGRIAIGFLIVQDIVAVLILMAITSFSRGASILDFVINFSISSALLVALYLVGIRLLPLFTRLIAKSQEMLLLFSIAWCVLLSLAFSMVGFSAEIGALLAGITLSSSPYRHEIGSKMRVLRDFFIVMFFMQLGAQMIFTDINQYAYQIAVLSFFVLVGNPLIVIILMGILGYTKRTSFLAGLATAQISEFSLILVALGVKVGHLSSGILSLVTGVGIITIAGSTYFILYSNKIYPFISGFLSIFERKRTVDTKEVMAKKKQYDVILFGYNRIGYSIVDAFGKLKKNYLVVDYNPDVIADLTRKRIPCIYGDANDIELLDDLNLSRVSFIVSTIPSLDTNLLLLQKARSENKNIGVIVVSHHIDDAIELYKNGATYVVMPHFLGGEYVSSLITLYGLDKESFAKEGKKQLKNLYIRKKLGHEHPVVDYKHS